MKETNCPLDGTTLLLKRGTPCGEGGADDFELDHFEEHRVHECVVYHGLKLVLGDFYDVDFGSYDPTYFGFEKRKRMGYEDFEWVREVTDTRRREGKYCPECHYKMPLLTFV
ncbi:hypothetical protein FK220_013485 [Flavobacteriaceae bacterium TP-CH-4]|uniref:Uncharacterized protein n=1 Tax=Pelagihabitans pacificus TaxID=2696054 RepID=A0A967EBI7_9FLAO|nr:hypothetical protein [Pelagihabitans pacificus]NHF60361.1 hypothetical protein [Pelagihabitans pacificus]